ncbi:MAG: hydantoinase B/oxoprolinase family protein [Thermodesulfobacteriota bacterium]|nr:hydantoinase B/oxoprolinase family protein [Thermodesulfobacteriota bacterium]
MKFKQKINFSIDRGGTFTDIYAEFPDGRTQVIKLLSEDSGNYPDAPREGIRRILEHELGKPLPAAQLSAEHIASIRMGTTVATNALLERKGAKTVLLITKGFSDLLLIGNQSRPDIFALDIQRHQPLYQQVIEVDERIRPAQDGDMGSEIERVMGSNGREYVVLQTPDPAPILQALRQASASGCTSVAVVLAHAYACPDHEVEIAALVRQVGFEHCSLSHQVMPTVRMVPRGSTTIVDAYLTPHIQRYVHSFCEGFTDGLATTELLFMASDGGLLPALSFNGSRALLSGPAGGVVGYAQTCAMALPDVPVIGFDMGGTSTDVSRYAGHYEQTQDAEVAGVRIQAPQLQIKTVAAGGGSRLFFRHGMFEVGPESAGSHPGPICYRKNGYLTVTDANVLLGRLQPSFFPSIFGSNEDQPLDVAATQKAFAELTHEINHWLLHNGRQSMTVEAVAAGFIDVANEVMARPIRAVSVQRGYDLADHALACFGGAGGQHACAMAQKLGMKNIFIHRHAGILSAYGMGIACRVSERQEAASGAFSEQRRGYFHQRLEYLVEQACTDLGCPVPNCDVSGDGSVEVERYLNLRYAGTDNALMVQCHNDGDYLSAFAAHHRCEFGFELDTAVEVDDVRVRVSYVALPSIPSASAVAQAAIGGEGNSDVPTPVATGKCYLDGDWHHVPIYHLEQLPVGTQIDGPAILIQQTATVVVEPQCCARINWQGDLLIEVDAFAAEISTELDPIQLALFSHRFMSIAEQMGHTLQRTAISTNIKERCDFSCALFNAQGDLVANAPHTPVHLGAMSEAVRQQIERFAGNLVPGDVLVCNHPQMGGSHLPDITVITPIFNDGQVVMYVANRGHHADIGGITPGSMPPFSRILSEEGCAIKGMKLVRGGVFQQSEVEEVFSRNGRDVQGGVIPGSRRLADNISDLKAQVASNQCGVRLMSELIAASGLPTVHAYMGYLQDHAEQAVRHGLQQLARQLKKRYGHAQVQAQDYLDDGTVIALNLTIGDAGEACFDFSGTGLQQWGNLNAPRAVTMSAVLYCLRCLVHDEIPLNQGCLRSVEVILTEGSLLSPRADAAVVGGNVLTSQRVVDVIFKAFGTVAASQGCMNNLTFGDDNFGYYETIGGGAGAGPHWHGCSGVHTHMTNTRITDVEIVENRYPVMVREFSLRNGSGGCGHYRGGDGLVRELEFLRPLQAAILSERRVFAPYGVQGGAAGARGNNVLINHAGEQISLGGKNMLIINAGERLRIETPGGGGFGKVRLVDRII